MIKRSHFFKWGILLLSAVLGMGKINIVMVKVSLQQQQQKCLTSKFPFLPIVTLEFKTIYPKNKSQMFSLNFFILLLFLNYRKLLFKIDYSQYQNDSPPSHQDSL